MRLTLNNVSILVTCTTNCGITCNLKFSWLEYPNMSVEQEDEAEVVRKVLCQAPKNCLERLARLKSRHDTGRITIKPAGVGIILNCRGAGQDVCRNCPIHQKPLYIEFSARTIPIINKRHVNITRVVFAETSS